MVKQKKLTRVTKGRIYITATFNNTLITVTDSEGNAICWGSTGMAGFKGSRKSTPFAATTTIEDTIRKAKALGLMEAEVYMKGPGPGRDAALRVLKASKLKVPMIADVTPIPHNGCRAKKRRRV
ncbi:30S ribosomal protein S11 [Patescibacteria group bacterium]